MELGDPLVGLKLHNPNDENILHNAFPAKQIFKSSDHGAWYVAQINDEKKRQRTITNVHTYSSLKKSRIRDLKKTKLAVDENENFETQSMLDSKATHLDGFYLLRTHKVALPTDLCSINIAETALETAEEDDLDHFDNVAYINAAETMLPFKTFRCFISLRELEAPLCGYRSLDFAVNDFQALQLLDLSYNNISSEDIVTLGMIPQLRALYLTGNDLSTLPLQMYAKMVVEIYSKSSNESIVIDLYPKLEVLHLDDNKFSDPSIFASLAGLRQLKSLNLDKNQFKSIPLIKVASGKGIQIIRRSLSRQATTVAVDSTTSGLQDIEEIVDLGDIIPEESETKEAVDQEADVVPPPPSNATNLKSAISHITEDIQFPENNEESYPDDVASSANSSPIPPFPELRILSLAHNLISEERAVLPVVSWPFLSELNLIGNPIIRKTAGEPPLLAKYLSNRLGIHITRQRNEVSEHKILPSKAQLVMPRHKNRQIPEVVSPLKKQPIDLLAIEKPGIFDPIESRKSTPLEIQSPLAEIKEPITDVPKNVPPLIRPSSQPLPPIREDEGSRPQTGPQDYDYLRRKVTTKNDDDQENNFKAERPANDSEPFFLTQVDELELEDENIPDVFISTKQKEKPRSKFDILYEEDDIEREIKLPLPKDLQSNVKALKYALRHPVNMNNSKLSYNQAVMRLYQPEAHKRMGKPKMVRKSKAEMFVETLDDLRNNVTYVEERLDHLLEDSKVFKADKKLANELIKEIQEKYHLSKTPKDVLLK